MLSTITAPGEAEAPVSSLGEGAGQVTRNPTEYCPRAGVGGVGVTG